ncbi:SAM-dependent methyltransferase [Streptomyces sp. NPDC059552]|uniref:SAM-dependent methyltransferase n=1 Tax=Streptomyces sp. NPDC059552 TaxID=3346862 RepID=UPI0036A7AFF7
MTGTTALFDVVDSSAEEPYQASVEQVYTDDPALWQQAIGPDLWFQFGVYDGEAARSLDAAGRDYFDQQLDIALTGLRNPVRRVLDVGFGWGAPLMHLARRLPACPRLDGVNISEQQTRYTAQRLTDQSLTDRVRLYLCNARDIELLPEPGIPYDLVVMRGSIGHMPPDVLEKALAAIAARTRPGATVVISETLYNFPLTEYRSVLPDEVDRLACGHRKTPADVLNALELNRLTVRDVRILPSNEDAIRWLKAVKANIIRDLPPDLPQPLVEMRDVADNLSAALAADAVSVYSIVARRAD